MEFEVIRSSRKTVSLEITADGKLRVRAPLRMSQRQILDFVESRQEWIVRHRRIMAERQACRPPVEPLTQKELQDLADRAMRILPARTAYFAALVGVTYGRITIRNQKTRWGSCSSKGNLNYNCLLMLAPSSIQDYVVVHELCHRKEMNHSKKFWAEVERILPDYRERKNWLRKYGHVLMDRMPG